MYATASIRDPEQLPPGRVAGPRWNVLDPALLRPPGQAPAAGTALTYQGAHSLRQQQKSWSGMSASIAEMRCDGSLHVDLSGARTSLSVTLEEVGGRFTILSNGWRIQSSPRDSAQPLSLIPAGLPAYGHGDGVRFLRHLLLQFDLAALARMAEDELDITDAFELRPGFLDPSVLCLAELIAEECRTDQPHSGLYGDRLTMALVLALSRRKTSNSQSSGKLAPWQFRRVDEYVAAHLADNISLQNLCDLVKLSRSHFCRAFKQSTGLSPNQWLIRARIAKAKQLLLKVDAPLGQIAIHVGFGDQSHFTRSFGKEVGESPGAWRRARSDFTSFCALKGGA